MFHRGQQGPVGLAEEIEFAVQQQQAATPIQVGRNQPRMTPEQLARATRQGERLADRISHAVTTERGQRRVFAATDEDLEEL